MVVVVVVVILLNIIGGVDSVGGSDGGEAAVVGGERGDEGDGYWCQCLVCKAEYDFAYVDFNSGNC